MHRLFSGKSLFVCAAAICTLMPASVHSGKKPYSSKRWEKAIAAFETMDAKSPPPKGAVLFVGSSSIRQWKLEKYFPDRNVINRGFGGSQLADSVYYCERIITKHKPRIVVIYAGDNDINAKKSPEQVKKDFEALVKRIRKMLPNVRIIFIAIKPSVRRWSQFADQKSANRMIADICRQDKALVYADIVTPMLGDDGMPRKNLFVKDGLHLSHAGYQIWTKVLQPLLK